MWVRFLKNFDWNPPERNGKLTLAFVAYEVRNVRRLCGEAAVKAGAAETVVHDKTTGEWIAGTDPADDKDPDTADQPAKASDAPAAKEETPNAS